MKLNEKKVVIAKTEFVFKECSMEEMLPILGRFSDPEANKLEAQLDLLKLVVYVDGDLVGDKLGQYGASLFMLLAPHAIEVCGMASADGD